jgi:thiopeptide-type bacteriocin biosynthesis protein
LVDALCESRPGATLNKVEQLITELWQQTLLLTDLRPPLTTADPARYVSQHLADIPAAGHTLAALEAVLDAASSWDTLPPEEGAAAYRELLNQAKTMIPSPVKTPLQTDMALALNGRHINQDIGTEAARAAELLLRLTPLPDGLPYLTAYRREFVSRYGECREVPLLEVLDSNFGLGSPTAYNTSSAWRVATSKAAGRSQTLLDLACAALRDRRSVVELDAATLSRLETWPPSPDTAPPSMDIYAFVAASSAAAMDAGEFQVIVGPNLGAMAAGRNLARFADMLAPEAETALERAARAEEAQLPRCIWAELVYLPSQLRSANVVIRPAVRTHEIALAVSPGVSASNVIPLDELVLGVRDNRFYVRWPTENTEVAVSAGHMLNHMNAPAVCRFLADVGRDGMPQLSEFDWGTATNFPFLPRIQVGRIVLHPAQWRVSKEYLRPTPPDVFMERLDLWREHWQVPRHVYMSAGDNRLLLDLEDAKQADELRTELRDLQDREQILLQEVLPGFDKVWTNGPGGRFITEFVVSLVRRSNPSSVGVTANATATTSRQSSYAPITYVPAVAQPSQLCPPGSDWLFAKLYCPRDLAEDLIVGPLLTFADDAVSSGWAKKWFFLRYSDPEPHLRLRFQSVPELLSGELLPRLCAWGAELMARDLCLRFGLDTYEREVERYGGPSGVSAAESLFAADSRAVAQLLHLIGRRELQLDRILLAVVSVDDLLMSLRMDEVTRLQWYREQVTSRREVSHEYRQLKSSLRSLVSDPGHLLAQPGGEAAARILAARRAALAPVADRLVGLAEQNELSQPLTTLYRSFVHLHCNRLLGIDLHAERQVLSLLLRTREGLGRAPGALHSAADS